MARALLIPYAHRETVKPGGTLIFSKGISPGALGAGGCAMGARGESFIAGGIPCFHGGSCALAETARAPTMSTATEVTMMRRMAASDAQEVVGVPGKVIVCYRNY